MNVKALKTYIGIISIGIFLCTPSYTKALGISPLKITQTLNPGETIEVPITITNTKESAIRIAPHIDSFTTEEQTDTIVFGQKSIAESWITTPQKTYQIAGGESLVIPFTIAVPSSGTPGSYALGLFAKEDIEQEQISIQSNIGALLLLYVGGEITESLVRSSFETKKQLYTDSPVDATITFQNNGNIHLTPEGTITVTNRKREILLRKKINRTNQLVHPGETWTQAIVVDKLDTKDTGPLTIKADLTYGLKQKRIIDSISVWYIPKNIIVLSVVGIILILTGATGTIIYVRKKKNT